MERDGILIIGGTGLLGRDLSAYFASNRHFAVSAPSSEELDLTDPQSIERAIEKYRPQHILNAAGYTEVDKAETERIRAQQLNAEGPAHLAEIGNRLQIPIFHFSTDYVFDGTLGRPLTESDPPSPINHYGATKLAGDQAVLKFPLNTVLRIQWLYGKSKNRFAWLKEAKVATPFNDQFGAPTYTADIAKITGELLTRHRSGLFHLSYDDHTTWEEVFRLVKSVWKLPLELKPVTTASLHLPAARPKFGVLDNRKLREALGWPKLGSWKTSLERYLLDTR